MSLDNAPSLFNFAQVQELYMRQAASSLDISQRNLLSVGFGSHVYVSEWRVLAEFSFTSFSSRAIDHFSPTSCLFRAQVHQDPFKSLERNPYMTHHIAGQSVRETRFVPYEDVLGIGHSQGMSSIVVPGRETLCLAAETLARQGFRLCRTLMWSPFVSCLPNVLHR
jgi:U3 small nucleolar RNA-associated protein 7